MVVNDRQLANSALKAILDKPAIENVIFFKRALPGTKYSESLRACFEKSDFLYAAKRGAFYGAVGLKMTSLLDCTVWFAHTEGAKDNTRFLLRQGRLAFAWFVAQIAPLGIVGNAYIHRDFGMALRLAERFGFSKMMQVGDILVYKTVLGEL